MGKRYLITGGAGFLGINLIRFLLKKGCSVISLDTADFEYDDVKNDIRIIKGDIRDRKIVDKSMEQIDIVVHTAAALPLYKKKIFSPRISMAQEI